MNQNIYVPPTRNKRISDAYVDVMWLANWENKKIEDLAVGLLDIVNSHFPKYYDMVEKKIQSQAVKELKYMRLKDHLMWHTMKYLQRYSQNGTKNEQKRVYDSSSYGSCGGSCKCR